MKNLKVSDGIDSVHGRNSFIPSGGLVIRGYRTNILALYDTDAEVLESGFVPCDGRALNTYTYRNLHSVISNIYGGTAYSAGVTNIPGAATTFNIPDLRTSLKYLTGANAVNPSITSNSNSVTHTHGITLTNNNFGDNATTGVNHSHSINTVTNNVNTIGNHAGHTWTAAFGAFNSGQATAYTQAKVDGNAVASASNHNHLRNAYNIAFGVGNTTNNTGTPHTHTTNVAPTAAMATHAHSTSGALTTSTTSSSYSYPTIGVLYFIKI
jgi:hypothetical protein